MRLNRSTKLTTAFAVLTLGLTGCLKDKDYNRGLIQSINNSNGTNENVVEIQLTATSASNFFQTSFNSTNADTTIDFVPVVAASPNLPTKDVHVTLMLDPTLVDNYNTANGTSFQVPDPSMYTLVNGLVVTIPAGSHRGFLKVKFKPSDFIGSDWALGFSIASADNGYIVSGNLNTGIVGFGIKNQYDGIYSLRINTIGWAAYGIADNMPGNYPGNFQLITAGASSVSINNPTSGFANFQPALTAGGSATGFGATSPLFSFDNATNNLVAVTNTTPDDGRGRVFLINPAITDSRYDQVTRTIYAAYIMKQNGRPSQFIYDTLTYVGPR